MGGTAMTAQTTSRRATRSDRRARFGTPRRHQGATRARYVRMRNGSAVLIRQIRRTDAALLAEGFTRLSSESRRSRFLTRKDALSPAELRYLTDVDHLDHEALVALDAVDGRCVGVARYIRVADDLHAAEIAITVVDEWHRRGLGTELVTALAHRARRAGIRRFTAVVASDNVAVIMLAHNLARGSLVGREHDTLEFEFALDRDEAVTKSPLDWGWC
jgi:RimJ/RimL family protein N-acetyltransferase